MCRGPWPFYRDVLNMRLLFEIPHRIRIACDRPRELAGGLVTFSAVDGLEVNAERGELWVTTRDPHRLFSLLPESASQTDVAISELGSEDESLDAVFEYLVGGGL